MKHKLSIVFLTLLMAVTLVASTSASSQSFDPTSAKADIKKGKSHLLEYKEEVNKKIETLIEKEQPNEKILVTVTLSSPLQEDEISQLCQENGVEVDHLIGRAMEADGHRGTFSVAPEGDSLYDEETLTEMLKNNDAEFKGFIEVVGYVPNKKMQQLATNRNVFLVDPSADENLCENPETNFMPGVFWDLEEYELVD